jgi:hypothetical protein
MKRGLIPSKLTAFTMTDENIPQPAGSFKEKIESNKKNSVQYYRFIKVVPFWFTASLAHSALNVILAKFYKGVIDYNLLH